MTSQKWGIVFVYLIGYGSFSSAELTEDTVKQVESSLDAVKEVIDAVKTWADYAQDAQKGVDQAVKLLHEPSSHRKVLNEVRNSAGKALSKIMKCTEAITKVLSAFSVVGALLSVIFAFLPTHDPVMELMKEQFTEVNRKLDSIAHNIGELKRDVKWNAYASVYARDENTIENAWKEFEAFRKAVLTAETQQGKLKLAEKFTAFFEHSATANSIENFYRYLTHKHLSLTENILKLVNQKFKRDLKTILNFSSYFTSLMIKGFQLQLYYSGLKGYDGVAKSKEVVEKFSDVIRAVQEAAEDCVFNFAEQAQADVREIALEKWTSNKDMASQIQSHLNKKFDWYEWIVIVHDQTEFHTQYRPTVVLRNVQNKGDVIVFHREKGAKVNEQMKTQIKNKIEQKAWMDFPWIKNHYFEIMNTFNNEEMNNIAGFYAVCNVKDYQQTENSATLKHSNILTNIFSVSVHLGFVLKGRDEVENPPCRRPVCINGKCKPIPDTAGDICMCTNNYYGLTCKNNILDDFNWETIKKDTDNFVIYPVPDMTSIFFSIQDLKNFTNSLALIMQSHIEWGIVVSKYSNIILKLQFMNNCYQELEEGKINEYDYKVELSKHLQSTSYKYLSDTYHKMMTGTSLLDTNNILDSYRNTLKDEPCSEGYSQKIDFFLKYMFAFQEQFYLAWLKYLILTEQSHKLPQEKNEFTDWVSTQWRLYNSNGCGPLGANLLSNRFCTSAHHSRSSLKVTVTCENSYKPFPESVTCNKNSWSVPPVCYIHPTNGRVTCETSSSGTTTTINCTASCHSGWTTPTGLTEQTFLCAKQPCPQFTPSNCTGCRSHSTCEPHEVCNLSRHTCEPACSSGGFRCGRNAECSTANHVPKCSCKAGWFELIAGRGCVYRPLKWVATNNIPSDAVHGGWDGKSKINYYVCRAQAVDKAWHGGKLFYYGQQKKFVCSYEYGGREIFASVYQALLYPCPGNKGVEWADGVHRESIITGKAAQWNVNYYVCRYARMKPMGDNETSYILHLHGELGNYCTAIPTHSLSYKSHTE
ncbi:SE-cephalotoxin-like isoform X2 [Lepisosteus oculatus]|uniref:SE-cephalotoxin-like isoform X2 n=1 Tax=Lepisosteus oculatus TaxID=7918 RepID=UPI0007402DC8|nr:PREDICTED: SE-cephalotoxin-like isoform X2 [Lepisosteus oculatus]